jgi:hypothetical protein
MAPHQNIAATAVPKSSSALARCPHLVWHNVLGAETVAALLDYVIPREKDFRPGVLRNRESGEIRVDYSLRNAVCLPVPAPFAAQVESFVRGVAPHALAALRLGEAAVAPRELEFAAYRDGGHFGAHIDTHETLKRLRVLSCVYYFAATPRAFRGGELRLHGLPTLSAGRHEGATPVDIVPETDTLVAFPSWLSHEVLPVHVPSGAWKDSRFTINCWLHRVQPDEDPEHPG